ncbi:GATA zinc finger domain-containing protein 14 isoform X2 [Bombyx mori]|uniref:GATA zinc finger domain-containing protein 14 isoform X2 n=1 Tax=Bombyx mori TaxID=7091 RepID=UPI00035029A4
MSNLPKIPCTQSDWKTIDIFIFNNGQEFTPPRKYHLQSEELNWWNTTLKSLAKSQYGSLYSMIDLYTVQGVKIENPLRLSNGAAYVAVKPKDSFVNTGYEKYLVKASRSWEKSQARKNGRIENKTENNISNDLCEERKIDSVENVKIINDSKYTTKVYLNNLKNGTNTGKPNQNKIIMKLKRANPASRLLAKNNSVNNKRDVLNILKRNSKLPIQSFERGFILANCNKNQVNKLRAIKNLNKNKTAEVPLIDHMSTQDKTTSTTQLMNISNKSLMTDDNLANEEYNIGKDKSQNFNNNKNIQIPSGLEIDKEENVEHRGKTMAKSNSLDTSNGQSYKEAITDLKVASTSLILRKPDIPNHKSSIESVNADYKPNIEYVTYDPRVNLEPLQRKCLSNNPTAVIEQGSQTNLNAIIFQDTPKANMNVEKVLTEHNSHFVVCEYILAVPQNSNACFCGNNKKYIILLPRNKNFTECQSNIYEESQQTMPAKNSVQNLNDLKNNETSIHQINITEPKNEDIPTEDTQVIKQNNKSSVPINNEIHFKDTTMTDKHIFQNPLSICTQTQWCGVLLESKCHEDGRYSLHFPALDIIKRFTNKT